MDDHPRIKTARRWSVGGKNEMDLMSAIDEEAQPATGMDAVRIADVCQDETPVGKR